MVSLNEKGIKLEIKTKIYGKSSITWKLSAILNNPWVEEETKRESIKYFELTKNEKHVLLWATANVIPQESSTRGQYSERRKV